MFHRGEISVWKYFRRKSINKNKYNLKLTLLKNWKVLWELVTEVIPNSWQLGELNFFSWVECFNNGGLGLLLVVINVLTIFSFNIFIVNMYKELSIYHFKSRFCHVFNINTLKTIETKFGVWTIFVMCSLKTNYQYSSRKVIQFQVYLLHFTNIVRI